MSSQREIDARIAGAVLYNSFSENGSTRSAASSIGHQDVVFQEEGRCSHFCRTFMSPIRRTFCLFVVFDLVFSFILWIIYKGVRDSNGLTDFSWKDLDFRTSLFDTVLLASGRFLVLTICYALLKYNKPWAVAVTTFVSCAFLVTKAAMYKWVPSETAPSHYTVLDACVLVASFVLCWVETWLLDFKVLPSEERWRNRASASDSEHGPPETRPLLYDEAHGSSYGGMSRDYYSPIESRGSPLASPPPERFLSVPGSQKTSRGISFGGASSEDEGQLRRYARSGEEALNLAWQLLSEPVSMSGVAPEGWELEGKSGEGGTGRVFSRKLHKRGKIFRMSATLDTDAQSVYTILVNQCEKMPEWNPTIMAVKVLLVADESTMVAYNVAAAAAGGLVSSRDFVYIMHNVIKDGWYVSAYVSTSVVSMPPQNGHIRGEQRPGLTRIRDIGKNKCQIESLLDTDLKGWLPQYLIDQAMSSVMLTYLEHLKSRCATHGTAQLAVNNS